jgi:hypothetical protein
VYEKDFSREILPKLTLFVSIWDNSLGHAQGHAAAGAETVAGGNRYQASATMFVCRINASRA